MTDTTVTGAPPRGGARFTWPLRSGDFQGGHLNNVRFQEFSQEARLAWYRDRLDVLGARVAPALARSMQLEFFTPVPQGATHVWVDVEVSAVGRTSFSMRTAIGSPTMGEDAVAVVDTVLVVTDADGRPSPLTDDERAVLESALPTHPTPEEES